MSISDSGGGSKDKNKSKEPKIPKDPKVPPAPTEPKGSEESKIGIVGYGLNLFDADPWKQTYKSRILVISAPIGRLERNETSYDDMYADSYIDITHKLPTEAGWKGSYGDVGAGLRTKFGPAD